MNAEKKLILEMLSEGKINAIEAEKLLATLNEEPTEAAIKPSNRKFLKVFVADDNDTKVNINIPLALAEVGLKLVPKEKLKVEGIDFNVDEILKLISEGTEGELINVQTSQSGKDVKVRVSIE